MPGTLASPSVARLGLMGGVSHDASLGDEPSDEVAWRRPRQIPELAVEMRLVGITGGVGQLAPARRRTLDALADVLEAHQARHGLGRQPHISHEAIPQVAAAAPALGRQRLDARRAPRPPELIE